jgi:hypothetical protein
MPHAAGQQLRQVLVVWLRTGPTTRRLLSAQPVVLHGCVCVCVACCLVVLLECHAGLACLTAWSCLHCSVDSISVWLFIHQQVSRQALCMQHGSVQQAVASNLCSCSSLLT